MTQLTDHRIPFKYRQAIPENSPKLITFFPAMLLLFLILSGMCFPKNTLAEVSSDDSDLFTLPLVYDLDEAAKEEKKALADELGPLTESTASSDYFADNYVEDMVIASAPSIDYAQAVADSVNGELLHYEGELALIQLGDYSDGSDITVEDAVLASADETSNLPALYPNHLRESFASLDSYSDPSISSQWYLESLNIADVWEVTQGYPDIIVAVFDAAFYATHEDLKLTAQKMSDINKLFQEAYYNFKNISAKVTANSDTTIDESVWNLGSGYKNDNNHGTHVAGIIAAKVNNGKGIAGIAPGITLYTYRLCADGVPGPSVYAECIAFDRAIEAGVDIINMSYGSTSMDTKEAEYVQKALDAGITLVAALGNSSQNAKKTPIYPACIDGVISVAASDTDGSLASYSNYNGTITAPGSNILSTTSRIYNTSSRRYESRLYQSYSGTSMATPVVTACIALYMSENGNPGPAKMLSLVKKTAKSSNDSRMGAGIINPCALLGLSTCKHTYEEVITPATFTDNGSISSKCSKCGDIRSQTIIYALKDISLSASKKIYTGKAFKPSITVHDIVGNTISASNYKLTYINNSKVGTASVKVVFNKKKYSGSKTLTFTILPKPTSIASLKRNGSNMTLTWKKTSNQISGYEIQYSTKSNFKSGVKTIKITKATTTKASIKKLSAKKKYYVRIRTYKVVKGKKYYSSWSAKKVLL